jgi:hypothetical protein
MVTSNGNRGVEQDLEIPKAEGWRSLWTSIAAEEFGTVEEDEFLE